MDLELGGKAVLVTGGNVGIGRAIAVGFAREGAKVVIAARNEETGTETVRLIERSGGTAVFVRTDVSNAHSVEALMQTIVSLHGRLDCAVNNAGIDLAQKGFLDWTEAEWDLTVDVNLKGVWLCMKGEIAQMLKQGGGAIVNIGSVAGLIGFPALGPYVASKHGVLGLTRAASVEFAGRGLRVNTVCPGSTMTAMQQQAFDDHPELKEQVLAMTPMGRGGKPEEIASAVLWLCSPQGGFTTGATLSVDGGWSQH